MNIKDDFILKNIHEGYLVGGSIRDFLMGKEVNDIKDRDITIKGAEKFAKKLAEQFDATFITLDNENKIYRLVLKDKENYLDIAEMCGNTIEEDLMRRDFTINAIAYDLKEEKFIDITGGIKDIKNKVIRGIKEENFIDDPLRILRAFRFSAVTGFKIDNDLMDILIKHKELILKPAKERIHDEIMKLFGGRGKYNWGKYNGGKYNGAKYNEDEYNGTAKVLLEMLDSGILEIVFPCVKEIKKIPSNSHHHLDLIHHVIETVKQIELQYESSEGEVLEHLNKVDFGGYPRINHLKLAGFLHDIGKPSTWTIEKDGECIWKYSDMMDYPNDKNYRHRFIKHDLIGAKMVAPILKELKFSNKQIEYISEMIRQHIYPSSVISAPNADKKIMMRYIRKMGENVIDNIILAKADRMSAQGPAVTKEMTENNINGLNKLLDFYLEVKPTLKPLPKLLDGREIMQILKINQSPILGKIITELHEAQLNEEVNSKEEAIEFIKKYNSK